MEKESVRALSRAREKMGNPKKQGRKEIAHARTKERRRQE